MSSEDERESHGKKSHIHLRWERHFAAVVDYFIVIIWSYLERDGYNFGNVITLKTQLTLKEKFGKGDR